MEYKCPAGLKVKIAPLELKIFGEVAVACAAYEKSIPSLRPSEEYCPNCAYNTDNLRKEADRELEMRVKDFLAKNGFR